MICPAPKPSHAAQTAVAQLCQLDGAMARAHARRQALLALVRERRRADLQAWMAAAISSGIAALARCARGLQDDLTAVTAGLTLAWSHGVTAGHLQRLQLLKRQSDGRAGVALPAAAALRMLGPAALEGCLVADAMTPYAACRDRLAGVLSRCGVHDERL